MRRKTETGLVVFEGADGSGKGTQVEVFRLLLEKRGHEVAVYDFPQYGETFFGKKVGNFLNGEYGELDEVDPFLAAMLYAGDRFQAAGAMREDLAEGKIVLCNRYMTANLGHGGAKFEDWDDTLAFIDDMERVEYDIFGIPVPELTIYLYVSVEAAQGLIEKKAKRAYLGDGVKDIAERDTSHQEKAIKVFKWLAENKEDVIEVECMDRDGGVLPPEVVTEKIWSVVKNQVGWIDEE